MNYSKKDTFEYQVGSDEYDQEDADYGDTDN